MPLPSGLRAAGDVLSKAGFTPDIETHQVIRNSRPTDGIEDVERMGQNAEIMTKNPLNPFGHPGLGLPMTTELQSSLDARQRLNDLQEIGVY